MGIVTLRPNGIDAPGSWTTVGAASQDASQADDSDSSYIQDTSGSPSEARHNVGDVTIPDFSRIVAVRLKVRVWSDAASTRFRPVLRAANTDKVYDQQVGVASSPLWLTFPWETTTPAGNDWNQGYVNGLITKYGVASFGATSRYLETVVEVEYNERPTVTVTPLGTVTDTSTPTVRWTYADAEDDPQVAFEVRLFQMPGAVKVHDTGWVWSSATEYVLPTLENGVSYQSQVRVRQPWPTTSFASLLDANTFTLDLDAPAAPDVVVVEYPDSGVVTLELSTVAPGPVAEWFTVEYRDDPADGWMAVRGADEVAPGDPSVLVADYEAPFGQTRTYRVRGVTDVAGPTVASDPTVVTASLASTGRYITDPYDPDTLNVKVSTREHGRSWSGREQVHYPAGMDVAVVESEPTVAHQSLSVWTLNPADHELLTAAFRNRRTLLYRDRRTTLYFRWVGDRTSQQLGPDATGVDALTGSMVEVARPS